MTKVKHGTKKDERFVAVCNCEENSIVHFEGSNNHAHGNAHGRDCECTIMDLKNINKRDTMKFRGINLEMPFTTK